MKQRLVQLYLIAALAIITPLLNAKEISVEDFFKNPEFGAFKISPNGEYVGALGDWEGKLNLFVFDLATGEARRLTGMKDNNVYDFIWANDDRLLFFMRKDGNESAGMFAINKDGSRYRILVEPLEARGAVYKLRITAPIDRLKDEDDYILVANNDHRQDYPDVYKMDINTGRKKIVVANPGNVQGWITDKNGVVRIGITSDIDEDKEGIIYRESENAEWETLAEFEKEARHWIPFEFDHDGKTLYILSNLENDTYGIYKYDLEKREIGELMYKDDGYDMGGLLYSDYIKKPIGVVYDREKVKVVWTDEEKKVIQDIVDNTFPDTFNSLYSMSEDESKIVVASSSDRQPTFYTLFSIENGSLKRVPLAYTRKWIHSEDLAEMKPISFKTRDGLTVHGYLTVPKDFKAPGPMIVHPHGGPWARDEWGYDSRVQFMANRGFAVLQIDFRCSQGYGYEFLHAGDKKWGEEMQYDIVDGVQWAIKEGIADPKRIGIFGYSYGGYATMAQVTLYPDMYQFGIDGLGPVNLVDSINHRIKPGVDQREVYDYYCRTIGSPKDERELLEKDSPINYIERIKAPLLLIYGGNDTRVPIDQFYQLRGALEANNKEYESIVKADEGHGFAKEENRLEEYRLIDKFLKPYRP